MATHNTTMATHNTTMATHNKTIATHNRTMVTHNRTMATHNRTMATHNKTMETHNTTMATHNTTMATHNTTMATHNKKMVTHNKTMKCRHFKCCALILENAGEERVTAGVTIYWRREGNYRSEYQYDFWTNSPQFPTHSSCPYLLQWCTHQQQNGQKLQAWITCHCVLGPTHHRTLPECCGQKSEKVTYIYITLEQFR